MDGTLRLAPTIKPRAFPAIGSVQDVPPATHRPLTSRLATLAAVTIIAVAVGWLSLVANDWARLHVPLISDLDPHLASIPLLLGRNENSGLMFGFGAGTSINLLAVLVSPLIFLTMMRFAFETGETIVLLGLGILAGGAIGNSYERLVRGSVTDFIVVGGDGGWVLNVSDLALVTGCSLLLLGFLIPTMVDAIGGILRRGGRLVGMLP